MKQINVRIHFLTIMGILLMLRTMQLYPLATGWDFHGYFFMIVGFIFILIGDYM